MNDILDQYIVTYFADGNGNDFFISFQDILTNECKHNYGPSFYWKDNRQGKVWTLNPILIKQRSADIFHVHLNKDEILSFIGKIKYQYILNYNLSPHFLYVSWRNILTDKLDRHDGPAMYVLNAEDHKNYVAYYYRDGNHGNVIVRVNDLNLEQLILPKFEIDPEYLKIEV
jgi:hypothetical protein